MTVSRNHAPHTDRARTRVLITGFTPFPKQPINPTAFLAPAIADAVARLYPDVRARSAVLPTEWQRGPTTLEDLILSETPDVALFFGIASRAKGFEIETRATNACSDAPDAAGCIADETMLSPNGQPHLPASLPVQDILRRLRMRGIPVRPSRQAGLYLCNAVLYRGLELARYLPILQRVGFIHLPAELPVPGQRQTAVHRSSPLTWAQAVAGGVEVAAACLGRPTPLWLEAAVAGPDAARPQPRRALTR
jgi:pyroglutamyl-peptidase